MEVPSFAVEGCVSGRFQHKKVMKLLSDVLCFLEISSPRSVSMASLLFSFPAYLDCYTPVDKSKI